MVTGNKIRFLNIDILALTQNKLLHELNEGVFYTPNIDHLVKLQHDREFYNIYRQADWVVSDSQILYWLSKLLKHSLPEAIPGSSFFPAFYNYHANDPDCRIFLLGAAEGVASKAMENINMKVGRQIVVGALGATIDFEAGNIKRAPVLFQKIAMEWFYRFLKEPKRLFRRYFIDDIRFFYYFVKQLLGYYKDPFE